MPKLLIIDGSSMLSTSYYGNLPKSILFAKTEEEKRDIIRKSYTPLMENIPMPCLPCSVPCWQYIKK